MIFYTPKNFDLNEIFIIAVTLIAWSLMLKLPKQLDKVTVILIWITNIFIALIADFIIGTDPYNLYDTIDVPKYEVFDVVMHFLAYPAFGYLAMNYYKSKNPNGINFWYFIFVCSFITAGIEWLGFLLNVYHYLKWNIAISFLVYISVYLINTGVVNLAKIKNPSTEDKTLWTKHYNKP